MSSLVIAEHDNASIKAPTLNAVTAAKAVDADVHVLVAGENAAAAAAAAAKIAGVSKVIHVEGAQYAHGLAETLAPLIAGLAKGYAAVLAPETTSGKNTLPRVAALLDVAQISGIIEVKSADTFVRPIYAGNAMATVQSSDAIKVITVRGTGFPAASAEGGSASIETAAAVADPAVSAFKGQDLQKSDRPELTSAKIIVSGAVAWARARISS